MKTIQLSILAMFVCVYAQSQVIFSNDFSDWTNNLPNGWFGDQSDFESMYITQITEGMVYGTGALGLENMEESPRRFTTLPISVEEGTTYRVTVWAQGGADIRIGLYDGRTENEGFLYDDYLTLNSIEEWTEFSADLLAMNTTENAEIVISTRNTDGFFNHLTIDRVDVEILETGSSHTPVYNIQNTTSEGGNSPFEGQQVTTGGIVTATYGEGYWIQEGTGSWSGLMVSDPGHGLAMGDSVLISGTVAEIDTVTTLISLSSTEVISSGNTLPEPYNVSVESINFEDVEGVLIKVLNAQVTVEDAGGGAFTIDDGSVQTALVGNFLFTYPAELNEIYDITGIAHYMDNFHMLLPRMEGDVVLSNSSSISEKDLLEGIFAYPNPTSGQIWIERGDNATADVEYTIYDITGSVVESGTINRNRQKIDLDKYPAGIYNIKLQNGNSLKVQRLIKSQ